MKGFSFYLTYWDVGQELEREDRALFYEAIIDYFFANIDREAELPWRARVCFKAIKPNLKTSKNRARSASTGKQKGNNGEAKAQEDKDKDKDKDKVQDKSSPKPPAGACAEIIGYLNEKAGRSYLPTTKATRQKIAARFAEGFTVEDFKQVIDNKCAAWLGNPDMDRFLRPETLFGTKFEAYLNERPDVSREVKRNEYREKYGNLF